MPLVIEGSQKTSSVMAMISSDNIMSPELISDFRLQGARRQSKITQFINQVKEGEEMGESDLEKIIHRNRKGEKIRRRLQQVSDKERKESWGKLNLRWRGSDYIEQKTPQACLQELIEQKQAQKVQVTFQKPRRKLVSPKLSQYTERESRRRTLTSPTSARSQSSCDDSDSQKRHTSTSTTVTNTSTRDSECRLNRARRTTKTFTDRSSTTLKVTETSRIETSETPLLSIRVLSEHTHGTLPHIAEHAGNIPSMSYASTPSTPYRTKQQLLRGRSYSRNLFLTKKATGNEASNMFIGSSHFEGKNATGKVRRGKSLCEKGNMFLSDTAAKEKLERRFKGSRKVVPELRNKFSAEALVKAFISEQFLDLRLKGPRAQYVRQVYNFAIMQQSSISTLIIKHPEILPARIFKDLIAYKKQFEVIPVYISTHSMMEESPWRPFFFESLAPPGNTILAEVEREIPLYPNFYKKLITARADSITVNPQLLKERRKLSLREIIVHVTLQLRMSRHVPGSPARQEMMSIMAAAGRNEKLRTMLALSVEDWLDQLAKCLDSKFKSVREETCQILCYMTTCHLLMKALYISKYFDVVCDLGSTILKYMDIHEESFEDYYIVLVHLMHYTPSRGLLDCILDRHTSFKNVELMRRWPRLAYYALKYWPDDPLGIKSALFGKRVVKMLQSALQKPITQKFARQALFYFQLRYDPVSRLFTIFSDKAEKAYMIALGLLG